MTICPATLQFVPRPSPHRLVPHPFVPALAALRRSTRAQHDRIESVVDMEALADPQRYGRILQAFEAFLSPWEERIVAAMPAPWHPWLRRRSRLAFLREDLRALQLTPQGRCDALPGLPSPAAAWGSLYVIEGSALGGQVIARRRGQPHDSAYFRGFGAETGPMWQEFCARLGESLDGDPAATQLACACACETFTSLTLHLQQTLDERAATA